MVSCGYRVAVTVAGLDPGGGAGIAADLKAFAAMGVHGAAVAAAITVQDTRRVYRVEPLPAELVKEQLERILEDYSESVGAVKVGLLASIDNVRVVAGILSRWRGRIHIVVDPVWRASAGQLLQDDDVLRAILEELVPGSIVVPNAVEAGKLVGFPVKSIEDARRAARRLVEDHGAKAAIVKGGHLPQPVDVIYDGSSFQHVEGRRVEGCTHGTGCTYSAALAAGLARGYDIYTAAVSARRTVEEAIAFGFRVGRGLCPVNPLAALERKAQSFDAINAVAAAVGKLLENGRMVARYAPEVGINIAYAIEPRLARTVNDVAGVDGRIVRCCGGLRQVGPVKMGGSSHMARLVLALMSKDCNVRAALNVHYFPELVEAAKRLGLKVVYVDRRAEPEEVRRVEGSSMQWLAGEAFRSAGGAPDVIYDTGDVGKEPMVRILARHPLEAVEKLLRIIREASTLEEAGSSRESKTII
jgi:hydroxymethylpyrimidine kinase/phosphomethylpyrimidine kinase